MFFYKPSKICLASLVASDTSSVIVFFFRRQHIRCRLRLLTNTPPDRDMRGGGADHPPEGRALDGSHRVRRRAQGS